MLSAPKSPSNTLYYYFIYSNVWKIICHFFFNNWIFYVLHYYGPYLFLLDSIDVGNYIRWAIPVAHGLWRGSAAVRLLELRVWIPSVAWMSFSCESCVLSGTGLCVGLGHAFRGVLPSVVCLSEIAKPPQWGGTGVMGLSRLKELYSMS